MTDQQKIAAIVQAIQDDAQLIKLLKALVTKNIVNVTAEQLDNAMLVLGINI